ncbi:hypothetical protein A7P95_10225 [Eikenella longinqua]|uniref:Uncharacterized protein n=1 Tax=Eikenella longinqua TaxID=1795827 RepID=A0A1A9RUQ2_9NEIS|nr:hypothetical protein A7P95_10225 [Eikenella longinqua]
MGRHADITAAAIPVHIAALATTSHSTKPSPIVSSPAAIETAASPEPNAADIAAARQPRRSFSAAASPAYTGAAGRLKNHSQINKLKYHWKSADVKLTAELPEKPSEIINADAASSGGNSTRIRKKDLI